MEAVAKTLKVNNQEDIQHIASTLMPILGNSVASTGNIDMMKKLSEEGSDFKKALCRNPKTGERTKKPIAIKEPWMLIKDGEERCSSCDRVATSFTKDFGILSSPTEKIIYKAPDDDLYNLKDIQIPTDNQLQLKIEQ